MGGMSMKYDKTMRILLVLLIMCVSVGVMIWGTEMKASYPQVEYYEEMIDDADSEYLGYIFNDYNRKVNNDYTDSTRNDWGDGGQQNSQSPIPVMEGIPGTVSGIIGSEE
jgi:hypothetical protein